MEKDNVDCSIDNNTGKIKFTYTDKLLRSQAQQSDPNTKNCMSNFSYCFFVICAT